MVKFIVAASLAALIAAAPLAASAQTAATGVHTHHAHQPTGSYRSEMRKRNNASRDRARASAEHMRTMRTQ